MTSRLTFIDTDPNYTNDHYWMRGFQSNCFCMPSHDGIKTLYDPPVMIQIGLFKN